MLSGYKTYVTAALAVIGAIAAWMVGDVSLADTVQLCVTAILAAFLRNSMPAKQPEA